MLISSVMGINNDASFTAGRIATGSVVTVNPQCKIGGPKVSFSVRRSIVLTKAAVDAHAGWKEVQSKSRGVVMAGPHLASAGGQEGAFQSGIAAAQLILKDLSLPLMPVPRARSDPLHHVYKGHTTHVRSKVAKHEFRYSLEVDYADIDGPARYWWGGLYREDHFGDPDVSLSRAVRDLVVADTGVFPTGAIDLLCAHRTYGYCFNPISVFFVWGTDRREKIHFIVTEVTSTPWEKRTLQVLDVRDGYTSPIVRQKTLHVSPFNSPPDGKNIWEYRFHELPPSNRIKYSVTLFADEASRQSGKPTLCASVNITRSSTSAPWIPIPRSLRMQFLIHFEAGRLKKKGLRIIPDTSCPVTGRSPPMFLEKVMMAILSAVLLFLNVIGLIGSLVTLVLVAGVDLFFTNLHIVRPAMLTGQRRL